MPCGGLLGVLLLAGRPRMGLMASLPTQGLEMGAWLRRPLCRQEPDLRWARGPAQSPAVLPATRQLRALPPGCRSFA